ncbi:hypothetical protein B7R54_12340 [Subtercola boreus]|uniref:RNA polymerase subunit sigma-70 n=1 Tax=Subtercola boreus TaxID=120213 RepID=A0A3E0VKD2_9MICO|nr:sigma-70 family RNA polymerase sigma factor [Subtercola boreus]RFA09903.1 hypothetical protein B7R54_12340 [Subtercola boreus]TQL52962.1 RNA polymerase sigma-70 factor (ECF subfamily) [Subtercola boreus]
MGTGTTDEAATWIRAAAGNATAFGVMFDTHRDRVFGQALRVLRSPHDAEDATALVFLEAWRRRDAVRVVDGSIVGWLLVTTNFVCRNLVRSARRYRAVIDILPPPTAEADPSDDVDARLDGRERRARVQSAFAALSPNDQNVITLCVIEELTTEQAAEALGVPAGTVKSRLSRAKRRLANTSGGAR